MKVSNELKITIHKIHLLLSIYLLYIRCKKTNKMNPKSLLFILFALASLVSTAQEKVPHFTRVSIANSGVSIYMPDDEEFVVDTQTSPDGALVFTGEVLCGEYRFATIVVNFNELKLETKEDKESMLTSYLDYLQESFSITANAGYGKGHTLEKYPNVVGVIDYWQDIDEDEWAIKGWASETQLVIFMLYGTGTYPYLNAQQLFFDSVQFK